jgi:regulator of replication initiation timing
MTIEEAMDKIMELQTQLGDLTTERDALITERDQLSEDLTKSREQAQRFFLQVSQGSAPSAEPEEPEPEYPTCDELAKELAGKIRI